MVNFLAISSLRWYETATSYNSFSLCCNSFCLRVSWCVPDAPLVKDEPRGHVTFCQQCIDTAVTTNSHCPVSLCLGAISSTELQTYRHVTSVY